MILCKFCFFKENMKTLSEKTEKNLRMSFHDYWCIQIFKFY